MSLINDYVEYADKLRLYFVKTCPKALDELRRTAQNIQNSFYGLSISPPRLADCLDSSLGLLEQGDKNEWEKLLIPLATGTGPLHPRSEPLYHSLANLRDLFQRIPIKKSL